MKNIFIKIAFVLSIIYFSILIIVPIFINSKSFIGFIEKKTNYRIETQNFSFKLNTNLSYDLTFDKIEVFNNDKKFLYLTQGSITSNPLKIKPESIKIDYVYFDKTEFTSDKKNKFDFNTIPKINIKKMDILIYKNTTIAFDNITINKEKIDFSAKIDSKYLQDKVSIDKGVIFIKNNNLLTNNLKINFNSKTMNLEGVIVGPNPKFTLYAKSIPINDIKQCFLFFIKQKKPNEKNFIENFYAFKGLCDINLEFEKKSITGNVNLKDFTFKSVKLSVPFYYKNAIFYFNKDKVSLTTKGTFGGEKLYSTFLAEKIFNNDRLITGTMESKVGNNFAKKYLKNAKIIKKVNLLVEYEIKNHSPEVFYTIDLNKGSNIYYLKSGLGNTDYKRKICAKTKKQGNLLKLENYAYSTIANKKTNRIIYGNGLFVRKNQKLNLNYISINTNDWAPSAVLWSISKYIQGGKFKGNLKYYATKKHIVGKIVLKNSNYKDWNIESLSVVANEKIASAKIEGNYKNSPFYGFIETQNDFSNDIVVNDWNMHLKNYRIEKTNKKTKKYNSSAKKKNLTIKKAKLKLDNLSYKKIKVENIVLEGFVEDNLVTFKTKNADFAKGQLSAQGNYDITTNSSDINFLAQNIDSNLASNMIFNLKDQFQGSANAKMHFRSQNKLKNIEANCAFHIEKGKLTKLTNGEFLVDNSKNSFISRIKKYTNIKLDKLENLESDIKGQFDIKNKEINNIEIFNKNKSLSLYGLGSYNIKSESACLCLWIKYDKNILKGIRIFFIPLSWITKIIFKKENTKELYQKTIDKIPSIQTKPQNQEIVNIGIKGNINDLSNLKINLKSIK